VTLHDLENLDFHDLENFDFLDSGNSYFQDCENPYHPAPGKLEDPSLRARCEIFAWSA
jgi:hypothetical protein